MGLPPNDPLYSSQWNDGAIHLLDAWDVSLGDGAVVAVIDTGVDASHADLNGNKVVGWVDYVNGKTSPYDDKLTFDRRRGAGRPELQVLNAA